MPGEDYAINKIVKKRGTGRKTEYLVHWEGYTRAENTWEPRSNLMGCTDGKEAVITFEKELRERNKRVAEAARSAAVRPAAAQAPKVEPQTQSQRQSRLTSAAREEDFRSSDGEDAGQTTNEPGPDATPATVQQEIQPRHVPLEEPHEGKRYKVQSGSHISRIHGVKVSPSPSIGVVALAQYEDGSCEIVPTSVLIEHCPKQLALYYDSRVVKW